MESLRFLVLILFCASCQSLKLEEGKERKQNAMLGDTTILKCTFSEYEIKKPIKWFKDPNPKPINGMNNSRYNIVDEKTKDGTITTSKFTIFVVNQNDNGTYQCYGMGKTNNDISKGTIHLNVIDEALVPLPAIIGIIVGLLIVVFAVIFAVIVLWLRKKYDPCTRSSIRRMLLCA